MNELDLPTNCEGCKYAIFDEEKQIGCKYNLLEVLNGKIQQDDLYYKLSGVCLSKNKTPESIDIKLGYLFILHDVSKIDILEHNINKILNKKPVWIGISIVAESLSKFYSLRDRLAAKVHGFCKYNILANDIDYSDYYKIDQFYDNYLNGWTYVNEVGEFFREDAKESLTNFIINKGGKAALISSDVEQINDTCFYNLIYKCLKGNKLDFDENNKKFYQKNFYDKVHDMDSKMILEWKNL